MLINKLKKFIANQNPKTFWPSVIILILVVISIISITAFYVFNKNNSKTENQVVSQNSSSYQISQTTSSLSKEENKVDIVGEQITEQLKKQGVDLGFISSQNIVELGLKLPFTQNNQLPQKPIDQYPKRVPLSDIIKPKESSDKKNLLVWDQYKISAPIQWGSFDDIFKRDSADSTDFTKPINNDPIDSPIQLKLRDGVVHLPFSPLPGEIGNSYIVGHSSNFSSVKSQYNEVFKPIERKSKPGEEFIIYDNEGRELKFRVFEALAVGEDDVAEAYKSFGEKRVVTLQGSILEKVNGKLLPTKRWLTRAELVIN